MKMKDDEYEKLNHIVKKIYCIPYASEFRQPVYLSHPDLAKFYFKAIDSPMDLGTILLKLKFHEYKNHKSCKDDVLLVFENCLTYNVDVSNICAIAKLLIQYTEKLWDLIFPNVKNDEEIVELYEERRLRYRQFKHETLIQSEMDNLFVQLEALSCEDANMQPEHQKLLQHIQELKTNNNKNNETCGTLYDCIQPLIKFLNQQVDGLRGGGGHDDHPGTIPSFLKVEVSDTSRLERWWSSSISSYLSEVDLIVSEICIDVEERHRRGYDLSSIWAKPYSVVWAQPPRSPWWPGMILAGDGVPSHVTELNLSRIPSDILDALKKLRQKTIEIDVMTGKPVIIATGVNLVEFFGTHDFGWVKLDLIQPLVESNEGDNVSPPSRMAPGDKVTTDSMALEEAQQSYAVLRETILAESFKPPGNYLETLKSQIVKNAHKFEFEVDGKRSKERGGEGNEKEKKEKSSKSSSTGGDNHHMTARERMVEEIVRRAYCPIRPPAVPVDPVSPSVSNECSQDSTNLTKVSHNFSETFNASDLTSKKKIATVRCRELSIWLQSVAPIVCVSRGPKQKVEALYAEAQKSKYLGQEEIKLPSFITGSPKSEFDLSQELNGGFDDRVSSKGRDSPSHSHGAHGEDGGGRGGGRNKFNVNMYAGCTLPISGINQNGSLVSVIHTRRVDLNAPLFHREHILPEKRKELLRKEIQFLEMKIDNIQQILNENGIEMPKPKKRDASQLSLSQESTPPPPPQQTQQQQGSMHKISSAIKREVMMNHEREEHASSSPPPTKKKGEALHATTNFCRRSRGESPLPMPSSPIVKQEGPQADNNVKSSKGDGSGTSSSAAASKKRAAYEQTKRIADIVSTLDQKKRTKRDSLTLSKSIENDKDDKVSEDFPENQTKVSPDSASKVNLPKQFSSAMSLMPF